MEAKTQCAPQIQDKICPGIGGEFYRFLHEHGQDVYLKNSHGERTIYDVSSLNLPGHLKEVDAVNWNMCCTLDVGDPLAVYLYGSCEGALKYNEQQLRQYREQTGICKWLTDLEHYEPKKEYEGIFVREHHKYLKNFYRN